MCPCPRLSCLVSHAIHSNRLLYGGAAETPGQGPCTHMHTYTHTPTHAHTPTHTHTHTYTHKANTDVDYMLREVGAMVYLKSGKTQNPVGVSASFSANQPHSCPSSQHPHSCPPHSTAIAASTTGTPICSRCDRCCTCSRFSTAFMRKKDNMLSRTAG